MSFCVLLTFKKVIVTPQVISFKWIKKKDALLQQFTDH